ncbi:MAG: CBS domain-containing protein [Candidatus Omnitrophica bacterium]|nr:CBS domain-containing protein [Candidatus Omnitrophota bacterium]MBU4334792.1 CBS domain-containing protein [Candidatus Omnitrophota bacterium]
MKLFTYLSELLGKKVYFDNKQYVGKVCDISMRLNEAVFPMAEYFIVQKGVFKKQYAKIYLNSIKKVGYRIKLNIDSSKVEYRKDRIRPEFSLCFDILDQQIVDMNDQKVVRVNDVHLLMVDRQLYLAHVDVGLRGLIRRLEWTWLVDFIVKLFAPHAKYLKHEELISWKNTHVLTLGRSKNVIRSDTVRNRLAKIPAAELADIMEDLDIFDKLSLFKTFSVDLQRKVFTDMAIQEKEELIDQLGDREAGDLLENIPADEATDLLHNLPKEKTKQLMRFMHSKTSKKLRMLLGYAQDTAGGLMTTEYLYLGADALVQDAIQKIKDNVDHPVNLFHIYIVDEKHALKGITSLRQFINKDPSKLLIDACYPSDVFVRLDDGMEEVALLLEKYKFSSIPVLDEEGILQGVITSDDVMEELITLTWKKYKDQI